MHPGVETLILMTAVPGEMPGAWGSISQGARLDGAMLLDSCLLAQAWRERGMPGARRVVMYLPAGLDDAMVVEAASLCGAQLRLQTASGGGAALNDALQDELDRGADAVVVLWCVTPTLGVHLVEEAFRAARFHDLVVGPTPGAGVWGLGLARSTRDPSHPVPSAVGAALQALQGHQAGLLGHLSDQVALANGRVHWLPLAPVLQGPADREWFQVQLRHLEHRGSPMGQMTRQALARNTPTWNGRAARRW